MHTCTPTYVHNQHTLGVTPTATSKPTLSHPSRASLHWQEKHMICLFFFLFSLVMPGFYGCGKPRQELKKKRIFLQDSLPSPLPCWEIFPIRWSQVERASGTQFSWKYLGHPSSLSITVSFVILKASQGHCSALVPVREEKNLPWPLLP